ncbi:MAG: hypothetical protein P8X74_00250 [Reinekea sp.]
MIAQNDKLQTLAEHVLFSKMDFVCRAPKMSELKLNDIAEHSIAYVEGICRIVQNRFGNDWSVFARFLGFGEDQVEQMALFSQTPSSQMFMRVDIGESDSGSAMLELNAGSSVGGLGYSIAHRVYHNTDGNDPLSCWAKWLGQYIDGETVQNQACIAIVEDASIFDKMAPTMTLMADELNRHGVNAIICAQDELKLDGDCLRVGEQVISHLYCLFDVLDIEQDRAGYQPLLDAYGNKQVYLPMGFEARLLGNKLCMALVHDDQYADCFETATLIRLRHFIPRTLRVDGDVAFELLQQPTQWVLKPAHGYGGIDVICGWEVDAEQWQSDLERIVKQDLNYIAQHRMTLPVHPVEVFSVAEQNQCSFEAKCLQGIYVMGGRCGGGVWRVNEKSKSDIINNSQGAVAGNIEVEGGQS